MKGDDTIITIPGYGIWSLARRKSQKILKVTADTHILFLHVDKKYKMTDGKREFMHLKWTAPDGQNVTGN